METYFWIKLILSFIMGSTWVTLSTIGAEKFGSKIGGLIGGLPSTIVVALLFIAFTQSPQFAVEATTVVPLVQASNGFFLIAYIALLKWGLVRSIFGALTLWSLLAGAIILVGMPAFGWSVIVWLLITGFCYFLVEKRMQISSLSKIPIRYSPVRLTIRAFFGGTMIAFAVFVGKVGGPLFGGIFATFPAMFLSTLIITFRTGGPCFSRAVAKSLLISGMINVTLYAIAVRFLYIRTGLVLGTFGALTLSLISGYFTYLFIRHRFT